MPQEPRLFRRPLQAGVEANVEPGHRIETQENGVSVLKVTIGGRELAFETGKIGRQAGGAVMARDGETVVYSTACIDKDVAPTDFAPLRVDYMERFSAAGMTSGGYNKRDGKASDQETLVSRLMDRPIRPTMHPGWFHETQLLSWVLSFDQKHPPVPLAITAASAALALSPVPLVRAIAGVTVGMDAEGELIINPEMDVAAMSRLNLTLAGTAEGVLMIEGECDFLGEADMLRAIEIGHEAVKTLCLGIEAWSSAVGREKKTDTLKIPAKKLAMEMEAGFGDMIDEALFTDGGGKGEQSSAISATSKVIREAFVVPDGDKEDPESGRYSRFDVDITLKKLFNRRMRKLVKARGVRCDGRRTDEVRPITIETSLLPRTHGSCLFTRGDTQAIATVTLGGSASSQKLDGITGTTLKNFYLQYTFPPSCVGEVGRSGGPPGRREIGHGTLAEKALSYTLPDERDFPYSVRVESLITESCGSSSMASVCGGSLAMMDAGIPVSSPIAGVAMGLLLDEDGGSGDDAVILTDILGVEDGLGTMDFKVAGNKDGISTFQLDIKCEGLTTALLGRALTQAKAGRLHILEEMRKALPDGPRSEVSHLVPSVTVMNIDIDFIGKVIGPGGKTINKIIEDFQLDAMDVSDDGKIMFSAFDGNQAKLAMNFVQEMLKDIAASGAPTGKGAAARGLPEGVVLADLVGNTYRDCEVKSIHPFGCFVEFLPGLEGLVHISELDMGRVVTAEGFLADRTKIDVKAIGLNDQGKIRLSRKAVLVDGKKQAAVGGGSGGIRRDRGNNSTLKPGTTAAAAAAPPPTPKDGRASSVSPTLPVEISQ